MSQYTSHYIQTGLKESKTSGQKKKKKTAKHFIYALSSMLGKRFFLSYPLFALADYHMADQIEKTETIDFEKAFEDCKSNGKYWSSVQFSLLKQLILVVGVLLLGLIAYGLSNLGNILDVAYDFQSNYAEFTFLVLGATSIFMFIIMLNVHFGSVMYFIQSEDVGLSEALQKNARIMTKIARTKLLYINLYYLTRFAAYTALSVWVIYWVSSEFTTSWLIITAVVFLVLLLASIPRLILSHRISSASLFKDMIVETAYVNLEEDAEDSALSEKISKETLLASLFEETDSDETESFSQDYGPSQLEGANE